MITGNITGFTYNIYLPTIAVVYIEVTSDRPPMRIEIAHWWCCVIGQLYLGISPNYKGVSIIHPLFKAFKGHA